MDVSVRVFIGVATLAIATISYFIYMRYRQSKEFVQELERQKEFIKLIAKKYQEQDSGSRRLADIIEKKKARFLSIPSVSFHFSDAEQIRSFYDDYFSEPRVSGLVDEMTGEVAGQIKGTIPQLLESNIGSKDISKRTRTLKVPDLSLSGMFLRFQEETVKNGQVVLGIEEVDIELSQLQGFDDAIEKLRKHYGFHIDEELLDKHRAYLKERAAERTLKTMEQVTGWVLVEGRFLIQLESTSYRCTYNHPVNEYLPGQSVPITISVLIDKERLEKSYSANYVRSVGELIPLNVYGKVWQPIDTKNNKWQLQLTPLAVY